MARADTSISFEEYLACTRLSSEWAHSYDSKDWPRLASITTPIVHIDYRSVMDLHHFWPQMQREEYVRMMSNPATLGNPLVGTQHLLGASTFERTSSSEGRDEGAEIVGTWQLRAHHVRFKKDGNGAGEKRGEVVASATGHAVIKHFYRREAGAWRLCGLRPEVMFDEGDLKALFGMEE